MASATLITPAALLFTAMNIGVCACSVNSWAGISSKEISISRSSINFRLPSKTDSPSIVASTPCPAIAAKLSTCRKLICFSLAAVTIASASGCSEPCSRLAPHCNSFSSDQSSSVTREVTLGLPSVTVPVLSRTIVSSLPACCNASPLRINMPNSAALPTATMMEIGVAKPSAHGQAIIRTVIVATIANVTT